MTYRGPHWDDSCDLGIKTGPVGAELFEQFAQAFGGPSDTKRIDPRRGNASPGRRFPYAGWQDEIAGSASHCSEGALMLIGASRNKLVFPAILQSRRRPMQKASAYGALPPLGGRMSKRQDLARSCRSLRSRQRELYASLHCLSRRLLENFLELILIEFR